MEMIIGEYKLIQNSDGYVIEDLSVESGGVPTVIDEELMESIIEDLYTGHL